MSQYEIDMMTASIRFRFHVLGWQIDRMSRRLCR